DAREQAGGCSEREGGERARAALAREEEAPIRRDVDVGGPGLAAEPRRQRIDGLHARQDAALRIEGQHVDTGVELIEQVNERRIRMEHEVARPGAGPGWPGGGIVRCEAAAPRVEP